MRYQDLTPKAKRLIWMVFLRKADKASDECPLTEDHLQELSENKLNGRQIKNVAKIAESLAKSRVGSKRISYEDVTLALQTILQFDARYVNSCDRRASLMLDSEGWVPVGTRCGWM